MDHSTLPPKKFIKWSTYRGFVPRRAVPFRSLTDGVLAYVGRAKHAQDLMPGMVDPQKNQLVIPWHFRGVIKSDFEILTVKGYKVSWVETTFGHIPENALVGGRTYEGHECLYIGRVRYNGCVLLGKVHPSHSRMYFPYNGVEENVQNYEILVLE